MRCRDLLGKPVLSLDAVDHAGTAADVVFDVNGWFVALIVRRPGILNRYAVIPADRIEAIGPDAITAHAAETMTPEQIETLKGLPTMRSVRQTAAMTSRGVFLGTIGDLVFDPETRRITEYLIRGKWLLAWPGRTRQNRAVPASARVRFGRRLTIFWEDELLRLQPWPSPALGVEPAPVKAIQPAASAVDAGDEGVQPVATSAVEQIVQ